MGDWIQELGPVMATAEVRYDLGEYLVLRKVITESHSLWEKHSRPESAHPPARRRRRADSDALASELSPALLNQISALKPASFVVQRKRKLEQPAETIDLTVWEDEGQQ